MTESEKRRLVSRAQQQLDVARIRRDRALVDGRRGGLSIAALAFETGVDADVVREIVTPPYSNDLLATSLVIAKHRAADEHVCDLDEHALVYNGHVGAPGVGISFSCASCGRPWLKIGSSFVDPREHLYELQPEDVR
jgi:hypothetical protein